MRSRTTGCIRMAGSILRCISLDGRFAWGIKCCYYYSSMISPVESSRERARMTRLGDSRREHAQVAKIPGTCHPLLCLHDLASLRTARSSGHHCRVPLTVGPRAPAEEQGIHRKSLGSRQKRWKSTTTTSTSPSRSRAAPRTAARRSRSGNRARSRKRCRAARAELRALATSAEGGRSSQSPSSDPARPASRRSEPFPSPSGSD